MNSELKPPIQTFLKLWTYLPLASLTIYALARTIESGQRAPVNPLILLQYIGLLCMWTYVFWFGLPPRPETAQVFMRIAIIAIGLFSLVSGLLWLLGPSMGGVSISGQDKAILALCAISFAPAVDYGFKLIKPKKKGPPPRP